VPVNDRYRAYRCDGPSLYGTSCESRPYVRGDFLEPRIAREIEKVASCPEVLALAEEEAKRLLKKGPSRRADERKQLRAQHAQLQQRLAELGEAFAEGIVSKEMLRACDQELSPRISAIEARLAELDVEETNGADASAQLTRALELLRDLPRLWEEMDPEEKRTVFELLIEDLRISRGEGRSHVKLKLRFLDECSFDLPAITCRRNGRRRINSEGISLRQLAYLALVEEGLSNEEIASRWQVSVGSIRGIASRTMERARTSDVHEAFERFRKDISEWKHLLPLDGRCVNVRLDQSLLSRGEIPVLKGMTAGKTDKEIASDMGVPESTVAGRRNRIREKLRARHTLQAVANAVSMGLLAPSDPSPAMLLNAYQRLASPDFRDYVRKLRLKAPTKRQIECVRALADGLCVRETAERTGIGRSALIQLRQRTWRVVGASSFQEALERVVKLGILRWTPKHAKTI